MSASVLPGGEWTYMTVTDPVALAYLREAGDGYALTINDGTEGKVVIADDGEVGLLIKPSEAAMTKASKPAGKWVTKKRTIVTKTDAEGMVTETHQQEWEPE
jgi:hypothetical protein